jgi:hypothetical protein
LAFRRFALHSSRALCRTAHTGVVRVSSKLAFVLTAVLAVTAVRAQISTEQQSVVRGVVISTATREPIGHALVYSTDKRFATLTDDQGRFQFVAPPASETAASSVNGTVEVETRTIGGSNPVGASFPTLPNLLMARKPGFLSTDEGRSPWDLAVVEPGKDVTIALVPEARIVGRVVLPSSNAADRITVTLYHRMVIDGRTQWGFAAEVATHSNGEFRFAGLEAGTYRLFTGELMDRDPLTFEPSGRAYGYPPSYFANASDFQTASEIQLVAGSTLQVELSPVRQAYYNIKLPVTNVPADDELLVTVAIQGHKGPGFELAYNRREQRVEGSLPNGTYAVEAASQGRRAATGSATITVKGGPVERPAIALVPNGSVHIEAKLEFTPEVQTESSSESRAEGRAGGITISVSSHAGMFTVMLEPADEFAHPEMPNGPTSMSQNDNTVTFIDVPPGRYWVKVNSPLGFAASVKSGDADLLRVPLTVHSGASLRVDVALRNDGAEISGTVKGGKTETPGVSTIASRARGFLYCIPLPDSPGQFRESQIMQDGSFQLEQLPPGSYRVLVFDRPQTNIEFRNADAMRAFERKGQVIRLSAGQKENLTLQVIPSNE